MRGRDGRGAAPCMHRSPCGWVPGGHCDAPSLRNGEEPDEPFIVIKLAPTGILATMSSAAPSFGCLAACCSPAASGCAVRLASEPILMSCYTICSRVSERMQVGVGARERCRRFGQRSIEG